MFSGLGLVRPSNEINYYPVGLRVISFPFWLLLLLTTIPTAWLWHRDRRLISSSPGHLLCIRCGYDLTGNTSGVCPECGDKVHPPAVLADSQCGEPRAAGEVKGESGQESKTNHLFT